jgi:hypothetical protein
VIVFTSGYLILLVYGYRINWNNFKIEKTSAIYIASIPRDADVYLNSEMVSDSNPVRINNVFPGRYDIELKKDGYENWKKTFFVRHDFISQAQDVILILKDKKNIELDDKESQFYKSILDNDDKLKQYAKNLYIKNDTEIYFDNIFLTRFSKEIKNLTWYADKKHIIFQLENEIFFMDTDGTNIICLARLSSSEKSSFISSNEGKYLIYTDIDEIKKVQITNINSLFQEKYFNRAVKIIR